MRIEGLTYIYKIINPEGQVYVGQTIDWMQRFHTYKRNICYGQKLLYSSIKKHGWGNHKIFIIEICNFENADKQETYWIQYFNSCFYSNPNGLNLTYGGNENMPSNKVSILQYDLNGNFMREWNSTTEARLYYLKTNNSAISLALLGKNLTAYGYYWRYKTENYPLSIIPIKRTPHKGGYRHSVKSKRVKPILQYDLKGNFIKEWESINLAAKEHGNRISECLKNPFYSSNGFQWRYKESQNFPTKISPFVFTKASYKTGLFTVKCLNLLNNEETLYSSVEECAKNNGISLTGLYYAIKNNNGIAKHKKLKFEIIAKTTPSQS